MASRLSLGEVPDDLLVEVFGHGTDTLCVSLISGRCSPVMVSFGPFCELGVEF